MKILWQIDLLSIAASAWFVYENRTIHFEALILDIKNIAFSWWWG